MFLSREKIEGERCMSAEDSSLKGSSQQSSISFPKVKGGGPLFSGPGPLITGGLVNNTTPVRILLECILVRLGLSFQKQKFLYSKSQPLDSQSGVITITPKSQL